MTKGNGNVRPTGTPLTPCAASFPACAKGRQECPPHRNGNAKPQLGLKRKPHTKNQDNKPISFPDPFLDFFCNGGRIDLAYCKKTSYRRGRNGQNIKISGRPLRRCRSEPLFKHPHEKYFLFRNLFRRRVLQSI